MQTTCSQTAFSPVYGTFSNSTYVVTILKVEFIDDKPDYALGEDEDTPVTSDNDSDNFFLREDDQNANGDHENLDIYYKILPSGVDVSDVKIKVYKGESSTVVATLDGQTDASGDYKTGDNLHIQWTPTLFDQDTDPGFYRLQLQVFAGGGTAPLIETDIADADTSTPGWQCPKDGLVVHDLHWKHRPIVHIHPTDIGSPSDISRFVTHSGSHTKEWVNNAIVVHSPIQMPHNQNTFFDLFDDDQATVGDLNGDFTQAQRDNFLATAPGAETVYHTAVRPGGTGGAANFTFLQYWMFYNFSQRMFGVPFDLNPPNVQHEGDMEHCQIAVRLKDTTDPSNKSKWIVPFGATASQHYYGQTLRWDLNDGSAAADAHSQVHVEHQNNRLAIYVAAGAHATYLVADNAIAVPVTDKYLGTQTMYDQYAPALYDTTVASTPLSYDLEPLHDWLARFEGRWGYYDPSLTGPTAPNGPAGPPHRAAAISASQELNLRDNARELHNRAIKTVAPSQLTEMTIAP